MVSGNKKSKSNVIGTPFKTAAQTTAQRQSRPGDERWQTNVEEQIKNQNELIENLIKKVNAFEEHIIFLEGKLAVSETVSQLLEKKADYINGKKAETINDKLEETGIPKEDLKTNIDKLHRTGSYQPSSNTQSVIVKLKSHSFKEKNYKNQIKKM